MRTSAGNAGVPRMPLLVLLLGSITAIGPMSIDLYLPAFPELARSLHTTEPLVQLTLTACLVGLAVGQALIGPLSDAIGRRRPLLVGMAGYAVASVLCALAPTVEALAAGRFLQGLAGSAGAVLAQALVRDLVDGPMVASILSRLLLVMGVAPVIAPTLGGQLLGLTGWRGLFWLLAAFGLVMTGVVAVFVRETLTAERRRTGGVVGTLRTYRMLVRDRRYVGYAGMSAFGFLAIFGYVSGSPFAYQVVHGVSPQTYGLLFGMNSVGLVAASQWNARLVLRVPPFQILRRALWLSVTAAVALVFTATTGAFGLAGLAVPLFALMTSIGLVLPNAGALALNRHPESAGTAAAMVGMTQFMVGAAAGPFIGSLGSHTAVPMAGVIAAGVLGVLAIALVLAPSEPRTRGSGGARTDGATVVDEGIATTVEREQAAPLPH
ncbi:MFS transporter, DHA1 family, bicyclomycin/chloramphenicol resistance protein [Actinopolymorpha cephalotaxi]|uniref:MFS transporter, DHA1 family, bicyclomycin/chloramphenicol resistance protein n=2 Tax=Actinopolymorpha cephalotaxi TaxID=504797 RepID=A0A1I2QZ59_9ACTN|nr:MFS transporter, DHA1 family, bicyclomycin/chloramphenicol resistance protein [Actinopolymorpha cephalotaxi]